MTCRRLEDDDLLAGLGGSLDGHVEQCPDCSARAHGYRRIAGWIADSRTPHRPPADWQRRTLAHVLATQSQLRSIPVDSTGPAAGDPDPATDRSASPPGTTVSRSTGTRAPTSTPRRPWSRAVLPIASAAIAAVLAWIAWGVLRSAPPRPRVAIEMSGRVTGDFMTGPGRASAAEPRASGSVDHDPSVHPAPIESPAQGTGAIAEGASRTPEQTPSPRRPGDPRHAPESTPRPIKRGGAVIVDWPAPGSGDATGGSAARSDGETQGHGRVRFEPPSGSFGGHTLEEIRRIVEARADLFRACYRTELGRMPGIHGTLLVHLRIDGDGRVDADIAAPGSTLQSDAVAQCVVGEVEHLRFPAKDGIADVNYAFEFID